jgi:hypothetical protein
VVLGVRERGSTAHHYEADIDFCHSVLLARVSRNGGVISHFLLSIQPHPQLGREIYFANLNALSLNHSEGDPHTADMSLSRPSRHPDALADPAMRTLEPLDKYTAVTKTSYTNGFSPIGPLTRSLSVRGSATVAHIN